MFIDDTKTVNRNHQAALDLSMHYVALIACKPWYGQLVAEVNQQMNNNPRKFDIVLTFESGMSLAKQEEGWELSHHFLCDKASERKEIITEFTEAHLQYYIDVIHSRLPAKWERGLRNEIYDLINQEELKLKRTWFGGYKKTQLGFRKTLLRYFTVTLDHAYDNTSARETRVDLRCNFMGLLNAIEPTRMSCVANDWYDDTSFGMTVRSCDFSNSSMERIKYGIGRTICQQFGRILGYDFYRKDASAR